jgi:putative aldouronate transport system substrate-binding protein
MKRLGKLLLCLVLTLTFLPAVFAEPEKPTLPFVEPGSETLRILSADNWYAAASFADNLPVYQEFEKLTGVKIEWEVVPADQYSTVRATRLAAAVNLPDIVVWPSNLVKLVDDGIFIDLTDLIKENAYYLNQLMEMQPLVRKANSTADGRILGFPGMGEGILDSYKDMENGFIKDPGANINLHMPAIRKDWLDKLGLEAPETLDDWYNVLKAFKERDPNGNGLADEIPLAPSWGWTNLYMFGQAYGLYMTGNAERWAVNADGKVVYQTLLPEFKELLIYLNKLYSEGLIDPEFTTSTYDLTLEKTTRNVVGAVPSEWMSNPPSWTNNLKAGGIADANFISIKGPSEIATGANKTTNRWPVFAGDCAITKDCKNPELAVKWLDFHLASPEGIKLQMFGVEGISYEMVDGAPKFNDFVLNNPDGLGMFEAVRSLGGWGQVSYIQTADAYREIYAANPEIVELSASFASEDVLLPFPNLSLVLTADEREEFTDLLTDAETYMNEMIIKFIEGKEPIDKFDEYVETTLSMGLERAIEIYQAGYDRFNSQ